MTGSAGKRLAPLAALALGLLLCLGAGHASAQSEGGEPIRLFGTVEFRGKLKALPKWLRVLQVMDHDPKLLPSARLSANKKAQALKEWEAIKASAPEGKPDVKTLEKVTKLFNKFPYRLDREAFGKSDYWATPDEFLKHYGDCEDFSIIKYYALKELGYSPDDMRIVVLVDTIRNLGHAVLVFYLNGTAYVLDNLTNLVLPHERFKHYKPQYSVNENYKWVHIPAQ